MTEIVGDGCNGDAGASPSTVVALTFEAEHVTLTHSGDAVELARITVPEDFAGVVTYQLWAGGRNGAGVIGAWYNAQSWTLVQRDGAGLASTSGGSAAQNRSGGLSSPNFAIARWTDGPDLVLEAQVAAGTAYPVDAWVSGTLELRAGNPDGV